MRTYKTSIFFKKNIKKLKGKEARNLYFKIEEILLTIDLNHYKNLKYDLRRFKRVHVNDSFVILFFGDDDIVYFVDYEHHEKVYKTSKKQLKK